MKSKANSRPKLKVIDKAIKYMETGRWHYSCWAIADAADVLHQGMDTAEYMTQYAAFICGVEGETKPFWWNSMTDFRHERIAALKAFRQACIDAATKPRKAE